MHQGVRNHFANNNIAQAFTNSIFNKELVGQMLLCKFKKSLIAFDKVRVYNFSVIVALHIFTT